MCGGTVNHCSYATGNQCTIVKNLYKKLRPSAAPNTQKSITILVTLICGIIVFVMALNPPSQLEWIIMFATGGLAAGFFWPMLLGLYWTRMNQWGAIGGMISGIIIYMIGKKFYTPLAMGMDPIMVGLAASLIACIVISMSTKPSDERTLRIFWGAKPIED
ncbi:hypothetical protein [Clostridium sp. AM58-1XD]|uniref:sodium:solute symporter family transporter n=1 Tax=Clostridium sp. AM58-1XD TaxID=2292307 RepID=UPI0024203E0E|nr:hypothetical protein [Clostridium sp. AM58-1XD]